MPIPFDPIEFYNLAQTLAQTPSEVCHRAAIGRAYYAMFLIARDNPKVQALKVNHPQPPRMGDHAYVASLIKRIPNKSPVANKLAELKRMRCQADYEMLAVAPHDNWLANWTRAETIAKWLDTQLKAL